ncbi:MAG: PleD family two-component system response regulator [Sphingobacteriia bacterium]|nr:PleD family two-component system response regulator [Sphingobacteriia bacterium]
MSGTVLVVDDLLPNIKLLEAKLNADYYMVLTAKSGREALSVLETNQVDIILLDVMMPEMDGFETCRAIKTNPKFANIPVIMVTALSEVEDRVMGLKSGADDFLTKPINDVILMARIKSLLRLKAIIDEIKVRSESLSQFGIDSQIMHLDLNVLTNAKIILIDDDLAQGNLIQKYLTENGAIVDLQKDPGVVIEQIKSFLPDVIIINSQLLNTDSLRLCSQMRSQKEFRNIPILLLVDEDEINILVKGLDIGVNDYIMTPLDQTELLTRINTQVKKKRYQDDLVNQLKNNANLVVKDALTGVFNRRYLDIYGKKIIEQCTSTQTTLVIGVIDIDHFKKVNDTYGHLAGDEVIKKIASLLVENLRVTDLVVRFGGEEFVIILANISMEDANSVAERVRNSVETTTVISPSDGKIINVTASFGLTKVQQGDYLELALDRADQALYKAKESGRNRVIVL